MSILYEAEFRVERAREHLTELEIAVLKFERIHVGEILMGLPTGDPREQEETRKGMQLFGFDPDNIFTQTPLPEIPPIIPVIIGEIAYNLVAALDYLVFVLAMHDSGKEQTGTQFPICEKKEFFERGRFSMLKGVRSEHVALIERLQPYQGCTWTKHVKDLSNPDKHRHLLRVERLPLMITGSHPDSPGETAKEARARRRAKLPKPPMKMYTGRAFLITFSDHARIVETLEILQSQVADVLVQFKRLLS